MQHLNYYFRQTTGTISTSTGATGRLLFLGHCAGPFLPLGRPSRLGRSQGFSHTAISMHPFVPRGAYGFAGTFGRSEEEKEAEGGHRRPQELPELARPCQRRYEGDRAG